MATATQSAHKKELDPGLWSSTSQHFEGALRHKIVGQDEAVQALVELYEVFCAGLRSIARPVGNLLFLRPTGSGKTLAFALPMVDRCDPAQAGVQALVLVPTRELAVQVLSVIEELTRERGLRTLLLIGGRSLGHCPYLSGALCHCFCARRCPASLRRQGS